MSHSVQADLNPRRGEGKSVELGTGAATVSPLVLNKHCCDKDVEAVYIGRGSKWGNPFKIGRDGDRRAVITKHEAWLRDQHHLLRDLGELRGKHLVCFCAPAECHGDTLLRLANGTRDELVAWWRQGSS